MFVGITFSVTGSNPGAEYVIVYEVPTTPSMPKLLKVAIPPLVVAVVVPKRVPPALMEAVTTAEPVATVLKVESRNPICGWVENAALRSIPADERAILSLDATPGVDAKYLRTTIPEPPLPPP